MASSLGTEEVGGSRRTAAHRLALLVGVGLLIRTGYGVVLQRRALLEEGEDPNAFSNPTRIFAQVMMAIVCSLYGATGLFGVFLPIRVADAPKPSWNALHSRPSFRLLPNRSCHASEIVESVLPPPATAKSSPSSLASLSPFQWLFEGGPSSVLAGLAGSRRLKGEEEETEEEELNRRHPHST